MLTSLRVQLVRQGPSWLKLPLSLTPFALKQRVLEYVLRWQFRQALEEGELDFLTGRWIRIDIRDLGLSWCMTMEHSRPIIRERVDADVSFSGNANDLLLIAARRQDPDTLFFQRRLMIEGDTELGLYVKNLMDAIELDSMPRPLRVALERLADIIENCPVENGSVKNGSVKNRTAEHYTVKH